MLQTCMFGRLLTAWSVAGGLGPHLVGAFREYQLAHGMNEPAEIAALDAASSHEAGSAAAGGVALRSGPPSPAWTAALAWLAVGIPIAWGLWQLCVRRPSSSAWAERFLSALLKGV